MKKKLVLTFPKKLTGNPITYNLIKNYDLKANILRADIDFNVKGKLLLNIEGEEENLYSAIEYLNGIGLELEEINSSIVINRKECVDCGGCTAVCVVEALKLNEEYKLEFDGQKCLDCKLCTKACPTRAINTVF